MATNRASLKTIAVAAIALALAALWLYGPGCPPADSDGQLSDLHNIEVLRAAFNRDEGAPRIILLLSPT